MPLSTTDQQLLEAMKHRELNLKRRQRATEVIFRESRRFRRWVVVGTALLVAAVVTGICVSIGSTFEDAGQLWRQAILVLAASAVLGMGIGPALLRTPIGRRVLAAREAQLHRKYGGDLHLGRRWQEFYYRGEDISVYIPQVLFVIEGEQRFDSVDEALAFVKAHSHEGTQYRERGLRMFGDVAALTNQIVVSSADETGRPSSRLMHVVKSDRPGVWYIATPSYTPKVAELDRGWVAVITAPSEAAGVISSNRVRVRRTAEGLDAVLDLYRVQAPEHLDGMTEADRESEVVYELTFVSAKVTTWVDQELVVFEPPA